MNTDTLVIGHKEDFYKYKRRHPFLTKEKTVDEWKNFIEFIMSSVVKSRSGIDLPLYLGKMLVGAFPSKNNKFKDKRRSCEVYQGIEHFCIQERDGFEARILYTFAKTLGKRALFADGVYYGFKPCNKFKKKCLEAFKLDWKRYVVIPNIRYMDGLMKKERAKMDTGKRKLENYNEFE